MSEPLDSSIYLDIRWGEMTGRVALGRAMTALEVAHGAGVPPIIAQSFAVARQGLYIGTLPRGWRMLAMRAWYEVQRMGGAERTGVLPQMVWAVHSVAKVLDGSGIPTPDRDAQQTASHMVSRAWYECRCRPYRTQVKLLRLLEGWQRDSPTWSVEEWARRKAFDAQTFDEQLEPFSAAQIREACANLDKLLQEYGIE